MARVTVGPKAGGGWQLTGSSKVYGTQREAVVDARKQLTTSGGGELSIKGRERSGARTEHDRPTRPSAVEGLTDVLGRL
jgi:Uncharacterized protein conserved in bacteria (DUF2188)